MTLSRKTTVHDLLISKGRHYPRHSRKYADLAALEEAMQKERIRAFQGFVADVGSGGYPQPAHEVHMDATQLKQFRASTGIE